MWSLVTSVDACKYLERNDCGSGAVTVYGAGVVVVSGISDA